MTIYFVAEDDPVAGTAAFIKIGYTDDGMTARLATLQTGNSRSLRVILEVQGGLHHERFLHRYFKQECVQLEWFRPARRLLDFIERCRTERKLDLVWLAPCSWEVRDRCLEYRLPPCLGCDACGRTPDGHLLAP